MLKSHKLQILLLLFISSAVAIYVQRPILVNYYAFDGDSSHSIYWLNSVSLNKAGLNENDLMSKCATFQISPGMKVFYLFVASFMDFIIFLKIAPIITSVICIYLMYMVGKTVKGHLCGLLSGINFLCLAWFSRWRQMFGSADPEEFSLVLTLLFLFFLLKRRYIIIAVILLLEAIIYPPLFFLCSFTVFGIFAIESKGRLFEYYSNNRKNILLPALAIVIGITFLLGHYVMNNPDFLGRPLYPSEVKAFEEFRPGGRHWLLEEPDTILTRISSEMTGVGFDLPKKFMFTAIVLFLLLPGLPKQNKKLCLLKIWPLWIFISSGLILAIVANLVMFKLYEPSRYIQNPLNIFLAILSSLCVTDLYSYLNTRQKVLSARAMIIIYVVIFAAITFPHFKSQAESYPEYKPAIKFISSLPKNVFLSGHPQWMNSIGIYSARRVFLTYKLSGDVYWINYYNEMTGRTKEFFKAYYAEDAAELSAFCRAYGITHMIVMNYHFSNAYLNRGKFYFRPFDDYIKNLVKGRTHFFLMDIPEKYVVYRDPNLFIIDCKSLLRDIEN